MMDKHDMFHAAIGVVGFALIYWFAWHMHTNPPTPEPECAGYNLEVTK